MRNAPFSYVLMSLILLIFSFSAISKEVIIRAYNGESFLMDVELEETFFDVIDKIETIKDTEFPEEIDYRQYSQNEIFVSLHETPICLKVSKPAVVRDYNQAVKPNEKEDITYIITTLANSSLGSLLGQKEDLKKAGKRINNVHPLRFLMCVFTDESLMVGMRKIRPRGWVWSDFVKGLKESLKEESKKNNINDAHIQDFASAINIDVNLIYKPIKSEKWDDFMEILIKNIQRTGDPTRYDL